MKVDNLTLTDGQLAAVKETIQEFIKDRVLIARCSGAVMGLSGGVDSAVVATLAAEVVDLHGLIMPQKGVNPSTDQLHAERLVKKHGITHYLIEIDSIVREIESAAGFTGPEDKMRLAWSNLKPRIRMMLNYYRANLDNRMVLGTGNRTECLIGYFTKYGDGGVDILPIGGLYKTQVWRLAEYLEVDPDIIKKPPSAGLVPDQTDEGDIGATYEQMDRILHHTVDLGMSPVTAARELGYPKELVERIYSRVAKNAHKLEPIPVCSLEKIMKNGK